MPVCNASFIIANFLMRKALGAFLRYRHSALAGNEFRILEFFQNFVFLITKFAVVAGFVQPVSCLQPCRSDRAGLSGKLLYCMLSLEESGIIRGMADAW
jgi:hypothetical protein